ncbi:MAG: hypothetical protein SVK54_02660 [candidate division WOR-3 bacterium]|nr:hypothetical protein [candidate division WOR-3 bacterium]
MSKCILLFSGGLDSLIAYHVLKEAYTGSIIPVYMETPFFPADRAVEAAEKNNIPLEIYDVFDAYRDILTEPRYGYGKNLNPCIDCHGFMINTGLEIMDVFDADFVATGEVIGQRPMSQNRSAFNAMNKLIKKPERILRPLSAKLMGHTQMETSGLVDRYKLLDIQGRGRKRQMLLADRFGIAEYHNPGGGCLLTYAGSAEKFRLLIKHGLLTRRNAIAVKESRVIEMEQSIALLGRNKEENTLLINRYPDCKVWMIEHLKGPAGVILGNPSDKDRRHFRDLIIQYSKETDNENEIVAIDRHSIDFD